MARDSSLSALYNGSADGSLYKIGAITKTFGADWVLNPDNPIFTVGENGTWDDATVKDPWLVPTEKYVMYYSGYDGTNYRVGRATAGNVNGPWTKYGSNPVIDLGAGGSFDDAGVSFPVVIHDAGDVAKPWKAWYAGFDGVDTHTVGYAYSSDGLSWTKFGKVIDVGAGGSWNDVGVVPRAIFRTGGVFYLYVAGRQDTTNPRWQIGLWTFTDPEGTYTPNAGNPIVQARFNDAGTSQSLTSDMLASSSTVVVASTSAFNAGEPVAIFDGNSETHVTEIDTVDSSTNMTVVDAAPVDFTTAQSAGIRPLSYNSVYPASIRAAPTSGFEMYVTPFQPVEDLTVGGSKIREGTIRMTSEELEGPWSFDYDTGLIISLGDGWDSKSAENITVVEEAASISSGSGVPSGTNISYAGPLWNSGFLR